jgi:hypothetical protein
MGLDYLIRTWVVFDRGMQVCANSITVILGCIALVALLRRREQLKAFFGLLQQVNLSQRTMQIRYTLRELERVSFDTKEERPQVRALLGQLCGQIAALKDTIPELNSAYNALLSFREKTNSITEFKKRALVHELHGILDNALFSHTQTVAESVSHDSR